MKKLLYKILKKIDSCKVSLENHILACRFKFMGADSEIISPLRIQGHDNIWIGNHVSIHNNTWLASLPLTNKKGKSILKIEDNCVIGDFCHIWSTKSIIIHKNVLIANFVYISDNLHCFEDISTPIINQPIKQLKSVELGDGCWIGEHVSIIGASVGKNSVVGANSVVTHDIPDYCVAVGSPAYIIKRYNFTSRQWEKTDKKGNFLKL